VLHIDKTTDFEVSWKIIVKPLGNESALQLRAWVEDKRRLVDILSNGKMAYIWGPKTGNPVFFSLTAIILPSKINGCGNRRTFQ
jgi:hypothetical protein